MKHLISYLVYLLVLRFTEQFSVQYLLAAKGIALLQIGHFYIIIKSLK